MIKLRERGVAFAKWLWAALVGFSKTATFRRFLWNTLNGLLTAFAGYLKGIESTEDVLLLGVLFAILNGTTKTINSKYLSK